MDSIHVLFAEKHFFIREGILSTLKKSGNYKIKAVETHEEFFKQIQIENINLIIIDNMFLDNGYYKFSEIIQRYSGIKILLLTNNISHTEISAYSNVGINNIIAKTSNKEALLKAIDHTLNGKIYYSDEILEILLQHNIRKKNDISGVKKMALTPTEMDIVREISFGLSTRQISQKKQVSYHTVVSHKKNIFRKLNVNSCSELIAYALRAGIVENADYAI